MTESRAHDASEALKADEMRAFVTDAFRDGAVPTTGTAITKVLPPPSRFSQADNYAARKQHVVGKLVDFFERCRGLS